MLDHSRAHDIVRPDLAGWRRERLPDPGEQRPISVVPDRVCELVSPGTAARNRVQKRNLYGERGIPHYWIVDVDSRTLEAFQLEKGQWMLAGTYGDDASAAIPPFEAIELEVGRLFLRKLDVER